MDNKKCVLSNKPCNHCGECLYCDIDPEKLCDNCCQCIDPIDQADYTGIIIDKVVEIDENPQIKVQNKKKKTGRYRFKVGKMS
jgi:hypothetical protein